MEENLCFLIPCSSAAAFLAKQTIGNHAFQNTVGSGLTDMEKGIDIAANNMAVRLDPGQNLLFLAFGCIRNSGEISRGGIAVWQSDFKSVAGHFNFRLHAASGIGFQDLWHASSIVFNQVQPIKHGGQLWIPANGKAQQDILQSDAVGQATYGHKLDPVIVHAD